MTVKIPSLCERYGLVLLGALLVGCSAPTDVPAGRLLPLPVEPFLVSTGGLAEGAMVSLGDRAVLLASFGPGEPCSLGVTDGTVEGTKSVLTLQGKSFECSTASSALSAQLVSAGGRAGLIWFGGEWRLAVTDGTPEGSFELPLPGLARALAAAGNSLVVQVDVPSTTDERRELLRLAPGSRTLERIHAASFPVSPGFSLFRDAASAGDEVLWNADYPDPGLLALEREAEAARPVQLPSGTRVIGRAAPLGGGLAMPTLSDDAGPGLAHWRPGASAVTPLALPPMTLPDGGAISWVSDLSTLGDAALLVLNAGFKPLGLGRVDATGAVSLFPEANLTGFDGWLMESGGERWFTATGPMGPEVRATDGTSVRTLGPLPAAVLANGFYPGPAMRVGERYVATGNGSASRQGSALVMSFDPAGTAEPLFPTRVSRGTAVVADRLLATDGFQLWVSDGTARGTSAVMALTSLSAGQLRAGGGIACAQGAEGQREGLWCSDGTAAGTRFVGLSGAEFLGAPSDAYRHGLIVRSVESAPRFVTSLTRLSTAPDRTIALPARFWTPDLVAWSDARRSVVRAQDDSGARLLLVDWEAGTMAPLGPQGPLTGFAALPGGRVLVQASDQPLQVIDLETGSIAAYPLPGDGGLLLVQGGEEGAWAMRTGSPAGRLFFLGEGEPVERPTDGCYAIPAAPHVLTYSCSDSAWTLQTDNGRSFKLESPAGPRFVVTEGRHVLIGEQARQLMFVDSQSGSSTRMPLGDWEGAPLTLVDATLAADGRVVVVLRTATGVVLLADVDFVARTLLPRVRLPSHSADWVPVSQGRGVVWAWTVRGWLLSATEPWRP